MPQCQLEEIELHVGFASLGKLTIRIPYSDTIFLDSGYQIIQFYPDFIMLHVVAISALHGIYDTKTVKTSRH